MQFYSSTPPVIDSIVTEFCQKIGSGQPVYVPIVPAAYAAFDECFPVVERKVREEGGEQALGWQVWLWPEVYIEAEFHAVWKSPEGALVDLTPKRLETDKILFVPDLRRVYEGRQVNNVRKSISTNQIVQDYLALADCEFYFLNSGPRAFKHQVSLDEKEVELLEWLQSWRQIYKEMLVAEETHDSLCPCGSGAKLKNCCEKRIQKKIRRIMRTYRR